MKLLPPFSMHFGNLFYWSAKSRFHMPQVIQKKLQEILVIFLAKRFAVRELMKTGN